MENEDDNWDAMSNLSDNEDEAVITKEKENKNKSGMSKDIPEHKEMASRKQTKTQHEYPIHHYNSNYYQKNYKQNKSNYNQKWNSNYYHNDEYYFSNNKHNYNDNYNYNYEYKDKDNSKQNKQEVDKNKKVSIVLTSKERKVHVIKLKDNQTKILFSDQHNVHIQS